MVGCSYRLTNGIHFLKTNRLLPWDTTSYSRSELSTPTPPAATATPMAVIVTPLPRTPTAGAANATAAVGPIGPVAGADNTAPTATTMAAMAIPQATFPVALILNVLLAKSPSTMISSSPRERLFASSSSVRTLLMVYIPLLIKTGGGTFFVFRRLLFNSYFLRISVNFLMVSSFFGRISV